MKKKTFVSLLVVFLAMPLSAVLAQTTDTQNLTQTTVQTRREKQKEALEKLKKERLEQRCKNIETRLDTRINRYENNKKMYENVFGNMSARLERLAERLEAKGADTTKLEADIKTLNEKINKLFADHDAFMKTLTDSSATICSEQTGEVRSELKAKIGEARKAIATVHEDRLDIKNFFQKTIKPDIMAIRKQLASQKSEDDDDKTEDSNVPTL